MQNRFTNRRKKKMNLWPPLFKATLSGIALSSVVAGWLFSQDVASPINIDDAKRSALYIEQLEDKQATRIKLQHRAEALSAYLPSIQKDIFTALQQGVFTEERLRNTPELQAIQHSGFLGLTQGYRNDQIDNQLANRPGYYVWYSLQDNTSYRQRLLLTLNEASLRTQQGYETLWSNRQAFSAIADEADSNFLDFYHLADFMGRRSADELRAARQLSQTWLQDDPKHAGAMMIQVFCLRNESRFDECQRWLDQLDKKYPTMEAMRSAVSGQIAFISGDEAQAMKILERAIPNANKYEIGEPYLVHGWISMANEKWARAKQDSNLLQKIAPKRLETSVLTALAMISDRPKSAQDALKILREAQLRASISDWYYQEALGIVHAAARDKTQSVKAFELAIANAPSHLKKLLIEERDVAATGVLPTINWRARLIAQWRFEL